MLKALSTLAVGAALALAVGSAPVQADGMARGKGASAGSYSGGGCDNRFSGFYGGIHGSYASLESRLTDRDGRTNVGVIAQEISHDEGSIGFGGSVGFNVQNCSVVWGVVADLSFADLGSSENYLNFGPAPLNVSRSTDWYGSVRTRMGLAIGGLMLYTTGGIGWADFSTNVTSGLNSARLFDDVRLGWVGGVGTEYVWSDRISIVSEALHYSFGNEKTNTDFGIVGTGPFRFDDTQSMWVTRIGINFKLGDHGARHEAAPPMK